VAALSDKLTVKVLNPHIERDEAAAYGVSVTPVVVVEGAKDYGIRFLGVPAGYEFSNLMDSILAVSSGQAQLKDETRRPWPGLPKTSPSRCLPRPPDRTAPGRAPGSAHVDRLGAGPVRVCGGDAVPGAVRALPGASGAEDRDHDRVEFEGAIPEGDFVNAVLQAVNGQAPTETGETREP